MSTQINLFPDAPEPATAAAVPSSPGTQAPMRPAPRPDAQSSPRPGTPEQSKPVSHKAASPQPEVAPVWLQRVSLFLLVIFCVYVGLVLAIMPWWTALWDHNALLQRSPRVWAVLRLGFVRGLISGLGLLDVWIGISEAIHYRDDRGTPRRSTP